MALFNLVDKKILKIQAQQSDQKDRKTCSFYCYVVLDDLENLRDHLYVALNEIGVFGRIYLAKEGFNAQISYPRGSFDVLLETLKKIPPFSVVSLNHAIDNPSFSFYKLIIKIRKKIVADGLKEGDVDFSKRGKKIDAKQFNDLVRQKETILIDVRNHYETEVGKMRNALLFDGETFRDQLPQIVKHFAENEKKKPVVMYCTGGIRCEKASAYLIKNGFENIFMLDGGITSYVRQVKKELLSNDFIGKNFVFDERLGERVSDDIIAQCHQCSATCDDHTNCFNDDCHLLFIQCPDCREKMDGCCSKKCQEMTMLPIEEQRILRRGKPQKNAHHVYRKTLKKSINA